MSGRSGSSGTFEVARASDTVYVRVSGLGTMNNSMTLQGFLDEMLKLDFRRFVIDLDACRGVDSTFMGILAGLAAESGGGLLLLNCSPHCLKQIKSVGLHRLLSLENGPAGLPAGVILHELPKATANPVERLKLIMRAHKELIRFDKKNEEVFGAFLRSIVKDLDPREEN